jgi:hypothetical protein
MIMEQTAWLFTKADESVRLEIHDVPEGVQLVIDGPGEASSRFDFPPGTSVDSFRRDYENKLLADGYHLQVVSERRVDVSQVPPGDRRRRSRE